MCQRGVMFVDSVRVGWGGSVRCVCPGLEEVLGVREGYDCFGRGAIHYRRYQKSHRLPSEKGMHGGL